MAKSLNLCQFIGNLGQDPEIKYTANGKAVASISIAVADGYKDKQTGQQVDKTEWVRVVAFDRLAEIISEYVRKGSKVYVSGKFTTRKWQDQSGQDRYTTEVVANELQMLDAKQDAPQQQAPQQAPRQQQAYAPQQAPRQQAPQQRAPQPPPAGLDAFDSDIPF